jgi:O-antigen ligase
MSKERIYKWVLKAGITIGVLILFVLVLKYLAYDIYLFFDDRIFQRLIMGDSQAVLLDPETSEGTRIGIWKLIIWSIMESPFFGSGYLGTYSMDSVVNYGSAHSQYMDVLYRTGVIGFVVYMYIIYFIMKSVFSDGALFYGFVSILVYGFFHETFKESQGAFIFAIYLGLSTTLHFRRSAKN